MSQIGRIGGPLLKENLLRDGIDLAFYDTTADDPVLHLGVNTRRISVNALGGEDLNIIANPGSTTKTVNLIAITDAQLDNINLNGNVFSTITGSISISPAQSDPLVLMDHARVADIDIKDNVISNYAVNGSIFLDPSGSGIVDVLGSSKVNGDLTVNGSISINGNLSKNGNIIVGDNILQDTVTVIPDFSQSLVPGDDDANPSNPYTPWLDLGSPSRRWRKIHVRQNDNINNLSYNSITVSDQMQIDGTTGRIYTLQSNDDINLRPSTGITEIESYTIEGNIITNTAANVPFTIASTGIGYVRFMDRTAAVIPTGTTAERPTTYNEPGMTRWSTDLGRMEVWDGTAWNPATGPGAEIGENEMRDLQFVYAVMLG